MRERGMGKLLNVIAIGLAFMMIAWAWLALTEGHFYGEVGVALNWVVMGFGVAILLIRFGLGKVLRPPFLYLYIGFFATMFLRTIGWLPI